MDASQKTYKINVEPAEFTNLIVGAAVGDGLPSQALLNLSARASKPTLIVACAPKSGSTFLTNVLSRVTNLQNTRLSSAFSTNEHDLYLPSLFIMSKEGCVSQMHMKGTYHNASLMKMFGIKPIILVRNIEDTIISLLDDLRDKERHKYFGSGDLGFSFIWQDHAIASLNESSLIDCLIDLALPWYVNFYVSWYRLCERNDVDAMWVTYEEMMQDKRKTIGAILAFTGFGNDVHIEESLLGQRYSKFNKGQSGRGSVTLSEEQKARIKRLFSYYPDVDFSKYGLENKKSQTLISSGGIEKTPSSDDLVDIGEEHHKAGRLQEAESHYRKALEVDPGHPGALYYLANIAYEDGRLLFARQLVDELLQQEPNDAEAQHLLGMVAFKEENFPLAVECFKRSLAIQPAFVQPYYSLGGALARLGEIDAALENFQRAVSINPKFAEAHFAIGNILRAQSKFDDALLSYRAALDAKPDFQLVHENLGEVLLSQRKWDEAAASYRQSIIDMPENAALHVGLGTALLSKDQLDDAVRCFEHALTLDSNCALAYGNLGVIFDMRDKIGEAITAFRRAIELSPDDSRSWFNLAKVLRCAGKPQEAIDCLRKAVTHNPESAETHNCLLYIPSYLSDYTREQIFADHAAFGERFEAPLREQWPQHEKPVYPGKRLRIGFVSGDLRHHPVSYFLEGVLRELRAQDRVDIFVYSSCAKVDSMTEQLRPAAHAWSPVFALSDDEFAQRIRDDKIDILIDLAGHTGYNRLLAFARKPAPIQAAWLGYWNTTGLRAIDYIFSDRHSIHDGEEQFYTERPWYLPDTRLCFTPPAENIAVAPLPALSTGQITFGSFNNLAKMTDEVIGVWSRILKRIPPSRLFLKSSAIADAGVRESITARFAAHDISADRLLFEGASQRLGYFAAYNRVDIALDPFPFNGGTISVDGLWMGVPVVTVLGNSMISRQGEAVLRNLDMHDWIAQNKEEYIELAVQKASDLSSLAQLRSNLRARLATSPLCDAKTFAKNLADAFDQMWQQYCTATGETAAS